MSINTTHLENLNINDSKANKIFLKMASLFSKKSEVIQIGIGGYSSSGKTVLIDAIFSLFDKGLVPGYLPKSFTGGLYSTERFKGSYKDYASLRAYVSNQFHTDHATVDRGVWNENTHCAKLNFCNSERILLIRNLPGEMFRVYFEQDRANQNQSIKTLFREYIESVDTYKKIYRNLFKFQLTEKESNTGSTIQNKLTDMREDFITNKLSHLPETSLVSVRNNFFAFIFYMTSDYNIYCIKSKGREENEIRTANENIIRANKDEKEASRFMICFTQFDRILKQKQLPPSSAEYNATSLNVVGRLKKIVKDFLKDKEEKSNANHKGNELINYWLSMNALYKDIELEEPEFVEKVEWDNLKNITGNMQYKWFTTSVGYNFSQKKFFEFSNQDNSTSTDIWTINNNNQRTPIGVLELMLYILTKSGLNRDNSHLPLPKEIQFNEVTKKII